MRAIYPFVLLVAVWWLLADRGVLGNEFVMPRPGQVLDRARTLVADGTLVDHTLATLREALLAFALALLAGLVVGTLVGRVRIVRLALRPLVSFLFPTPKVALYPAMLILLGLGSASKIAFGFAEAVFPILLATAAGTSQVDQRLVWSATALGTSRRGALVKVVVPAALPAILTGARIGLVGAMIGVFLGEMIAGSEGLGHMMAVAYRTLETPDMYVAIVTVSLVGYALDRAFLLARRLLLRWSAEEQVSFNHARTRRRARPSRLGSRERSAAQGWTR
jgi:ABC-type nitrate/sulfonate/bicarbonate transport system permease component